MSQTTDEEYWIIRNTEELEDDFNTQLEKEMQTYNSELLESFVKYCQEHPEQRFWQALRNWSKWSFVLVSSESNHGDIEDIVDTFYFEGKDG